MKILTVIGARPQFVKAAMVSRIINTQENLSEIIVHTGQHYDYNMSKVFFTELAIPEIAYNLGIGSGTHGASTGRMLEAVENVMLKEKPDWVLVYGDTNSTLAGALAAAKLHIPVAHVEAGLRSFNKQMPEEINRIITDHVSDLLFCPTELAVENLHKEGIKKGVHHVGDVMYDIALLSNKNIKHKISLDNWELRAGEYALCTIHRAENTNNKQRLKNIFSALAVIANKMPIVLPIHPRTLKLLREYEYDHLLNKLQVIEPVSYFEMMRLEMSAKFILTDSGGVQKEAFFHKVPCLTLRDETEWVETVQLGWNQLCGTEPEQIIEAWNALDDQVRNYSAMPYGQGKAAEQTVNLLKTAGAAN